MALLAEIIGGDQRAARHAPMLPPGRRQKYITVHQPITNAQLAAHIRGSATYAITLIGGDGLARAWAVDVDTGGPDAVRAYVEALIVAGLPCIGIAVRGSGVHDGGHIWGRHAAPVRPEDARRQIRTALEAASLPAGEIWPSGQNIRAPFGRHTHSGLRGTLIRAGVADVSLDTNAGLATGIAALRDLPPSPPPPAPNPIAQPVLSQQPQERVSRGGRGRVDASAVIRNFNAAHPIEQLLASYGATQMRDGWALNDGVSHSHTTQGEVTADGRFVFYTTSSPWAPRRTDCNGRPIADSFDLYTQIEHGGDKTAALRAINPIPARPSQVNYPPPANHDARRHTDPALVAARQRDAERHRAARRATALATLQDVRDRAAVDPILARRPSERAVLEAMLTIAGDRDWCRPSKSRLADMAGCSLGAVKRGLMELEARDYFTSTGDGGGPHDTAIRTFLRGSSPSQNTPAQDVPTWITPAAETGRSYVDQVIPESIGRVDLTESYRAGEPAATSPAHELAQDDLPEDAWVALLALSAPDPTELIDPAAIAAWDVHGFCAVPTEALPAGDGVVLPARSPAPSIAPADAPPHELEPTAERMMPSSDDPQQTPPNTRPERRRLRDMVPLSWHIAQLDALYQYEAERRVRLGIEAPEPPAIVELPEVQRIKGPPRDRIRRQRYYALLGRAKTASSAKQRRYLQTQALTLEDWYTPDELDALHQRPAAQPKSFTPPPAAPLPAFVQVNLFAAIAPAPG